MPFQHRSFGLLYITNHGKYKAEYGMHLLPKTLHWYCLWLRGNLGSVLKVKNLIEKSDTIHIQLYFKLWHRFLLSHQLKQYLLYSMLYLLGVTPNFVWYTHIYVYICARLEFFLLRLILHSWWRSWSFFTWIQLYLKTVFTTRAFITITMSSRLNSSLQ